MLRHQQHQIKRQLGRPALLPRLQEEADAAGSKAQLASTLCRQFGFVAPNGRLQTTTCIAALNALQAEDKLVLPGGPTLCGACGSHSSEPQPVAPAVGVPETVDKLENLSLKLVENERDLQQWTSLMLHEHPLHEAGLFGRQLKYLVLSECGVLGGVGFASAALYLEARDRWIGWDDETRRAHLDQVVCLSRLLIRPGVQCRNLASRVLAMSVAQLRRDFPVHYGYCPLLVESFCDPAHGPGTTYRAANWRYIGQTKGRGRQDRDNQATASVKDIYIHALRDDFRVQLGLAETAGLAPLPLSKQLEGDDWVAHEFADAPLGDKRLSKRLVNIAEAKACRIGDCWSSIVDGDRAEIKAYYRFIDQPEDGAVDVDAILAPHRERTIRRMDAREKVLCIQDGSDLNFSTLKDCEGLGVIGSNQTGAKSRGLHMHSTLAVTTDGLPLGILRSQLTARQPVPKARGPAASIPIEQKQSFCWIEGLRDLAEVGKGLPRTKLVCVMDREADIYETFEEQATSPVDIIVRAKYNRRTTEVAKLMDLVRAEDPVGELDIELDRQSSRAKKSQAKAHPGRQARRATVAIRYRHCPIRPPDNKKGSPVIPLTIIHMREEDPPDGVEPLEWFLLTSLAVNDFDEAVEIIQYYALRWRIEDWHRVVKSGCRVKEYTFRHAGRLRRAIAIDLVIAWRIMLMTLLSRASGELPPETMFSDLELRVLRAWAKKRRDIAPIDTLADAVTALARMGGYQDRKNDPPPGHQILWRAMQSLGMYCIGFVLRE